MHLEMHPKGAPLCPKVAPSVAEAVSVVDVVDATALEDNVEAVKLETVKKVSAQIAKLTTTLRIDAGNGNAPRAEESLGERTRTVASSVGSQDISKSLTSATNV